MTHSTTPTCYFAHKRRAAFLHKECRPMLAGRPRDRPRTAVGPDWPRLGNENKMPSHDLFIPHYARLGQITRAHKRKNYIPFTSPNRNFALPLHKKQTTMLYKSKNQPLIAHICLFFACAFWGLMAPLGKDAMTHGFTGIEMVTFRVTGGAALFWLTSLFTKKEHVPRKDLLLLIGAAVLGLVTNQCCYTMGLSVTSPINASIVTTSMPIFAMILAFFILKEPITGKKAGGVALGCAGAVILIVTSATAAKLKGWRHPRRPALPRRPACRSHFTCRSSARRYAATR